MKKIVPVILLLAIFGLSMGIAQSLNKVTPMLSVDSKVMLNSVSVQTGGSETFAVAGSKVSFGGTLVNNGTEAIKNITVKYSDGTNVYADQQSVNIAPGASFDFKHNTAFVMPGIGTHQVDMWVELDGSSTRTNAVSKKIKSVLFTPNHKVTFEEETGTWCGWCVRGIVFMDSMAHVHPNTTELVAVHNGDPMVFSSYNTGATSMTGFSGFPSIEVNRMVIDDPSNVFPQYNAHIGDFGLADITVTSSYNASTHLATINASLHFADTTVGNHYRLAFVATEDRVHSNTSGYEQHNYYSGGGSGTMGNFQNLANPVPAAAMYFDYVGRTIISYGGFPATLPADIAAGSTQTHTFNYSVPTTYNVAKMKAIVMLIDINTGYIINANHATYGINDVPEIASAVSKLDIYPNPFSGTTNIGFSLDKASNVKLSVMNILGETVDTFDNGFMSEGTHTLVYNGRHLSSGMYFLTLTAGETSITQKISIQK